VLKALSWTGVVWELGVPPREVVRNERPLGRAVIEKVARQLASSFPAEQLAEEIRAAWAATPGRQELLHRIRSAREQVADWASHVHLPHLPTFDELRARAEAMYAQSPSMDEIVTRARALLAERVSLALLQMEAPAPA